VRNFSGRVLKQFQNASRDGPRESRAYYWGISRVTHSEAAITRTGHLGHENESLEAEEVIEQSGL
jgi:hypothetical protein